MEAPVRESLFDEVAGLIYGRLRRKEMFKVDYEDSTLLSQRPKFTWEHKKNRLISFLC